MLVNEIASIVKNKVSTSELTLDNYISTDNMLPNYSGIQPSTVLPAGKATAFCPEDILLSNIRPYFRKIWFSNMHGGCNADIICLRVNSKRCVPQYLYYQLLTDNFINNYVKSCKGAKMPRGDVNKLLEYDFYCPEYEEQLRITNILGTIDTKIDLNKKIANNLERLANDYLDYYFSTHETRKTTLSTVISHEKYSVVDGPFGTQMKVEDYCTEGIPILEMDYLEGGTIYSKIKHFISDIKYEEVKRSTARPGDLIISKTGTLGLLGVVPESIDRAIIVSRLAKITPNISIISPYVLLLLLKRVAKAKYWERQSSGSTMPILNIDIIKNAPIVIATEMVPLNETINKFYRKIDNVLRENIKLLGLKNMILPLLMNGQAHLN